MTTSWPGGRSNSRLDADRQALRLCTRRTSPFGFDRRITAVYVTHGHADHWIGLAMVGSS